MGRIAPGTIPRAVKRIGPAAERGNAEAQAYLGFMYQYGRGVAQNYALAVYWYRRSAEQGNPTGQHLLGLMLRQGQGVLTDHVTAHMWLSLAAAAHQRRRARGQCAAARCGRREDEPRPALRRAVSRADLGAQAGIALNRQS